MDLILRNARRIGAEHELTDIGIAGGRIAAIESGLAAEGETIDLGVVSTPVLQHAICRHSAAGGISIGASHNAAEWNALKFLGARGTYLSTAEAGELLRHAFEARTASSTGATAS